MRVWNSLDEVPTDLPRTVVTLGNFDGVHRGHREVLRRVVELARARDALAVAVTFTPHPRAVHHPEVPHVDIISPEQRVVLLEEAGLDAVLLQRYTLEFADQSPEEFVRGMLVHGLHAAVVVVGHDVRFGRGNTGDVAEMVVHIEVPAVEDGHLHIGAVVAPRVQIGEADERIGVPTERVNPGGDAHILRTPVCVRGGVVGFQDRQGQAHEFAAGEDVGTGTLQARKMIEELLVIGGGRRPERAPGRCHGGRDRRLMLRQTGRLQDRRRDIDDVMELATDFGLRGDALGPVHDGAVAGPAPV